MLPTIAYLAAWLVPWRPYMKVRAERSGLVFHAHRRCVTARHISKYGAFEPDLTAWLASHLATCEPGLFVDAGANIGWHSLHAAAIKSVEQVVAFEPDRENALLFERGRADSGFANVILVPIALGARKGIARLNRYKSSNTGRHSIATDHGMGSITVPVTDLDSALDDLGLGHKPISVLKIDVEGFEPAVLAGAARALTRTRVVAMEISAHLHSEGRDAANELSQAGFSPFALNGNRLTPLLLQELAPGFPIDTIWIKQPA
jgi:FkbM family methyltransferase